MMYGREGGLELPPSLSIGEATLTIDPWERSVLQGSVTNGQADTLTLLVAEGVAFQIKCMGHGADSQDAGPLYDAEEREAMTFDTAVGLALLDETQGMIDDLVRGGDIPNAKKLSNFRNKVAHTVGRLKEQIGDTAAERVVTKAESIVEPDAAITPAAPNQQTSGYALENATAPDPGAPVPTSHPRRAAARRVQEFEGSDRRNIAKPMGVLLVLLVAAWGIFILPRSFEERLHVLQPEQLGHLPAIQSFKAKPPSLYVVVDNASWDGMSPSDQQALLEEVGSIAKSFDYHGAHFAREDGRAVGQWLEQRGARILPPN
jgi:hypothetical protein